MLRQDSKLFAFVISAIAASVVLTPGIGSSESGTHPDETLYLTIAEEMHAQGAWLTPTLYAQPAFSKPPLLYWADRVTYAVLGPSILAGRVPVALAAAALCVLVAAFARRMFGDRAGLLAGLMLISSFGFYRFGRLAMMDVPMALSLALSAWAAYRAEDENQPSLLLWVGVAAGASAMLKGPVGPLLILLSAGGYLLIRARSLLFSRWTAGAFALGAAIALPWYAMALAVHGRAFFDWFFSEHADKFGTVSARSFLYLATGLFGLPMPWTLLVIASMVQLRPRTDKRDLLIAVWVGSLVVVFGLPAVKFAHYAVPALPPFALLIAGRQPPRWARMGTAGVVGIGCVAIALALRWPLPGAATASLVAASTALAVAALLVAMDRMRVAAALVALGLMLTFGVALPAAGPRWFPAEKLAAVGERPLFIYGFHAALLNDTSPRPVSRIWSRAQFGDVFASGGCVALRQSDFDQLPSEVRQSAAVLERWSRLAPSGWMAVWTSWRDADLSELYEPMVLVGPA